MGLWGIAARFLQTPSLPRLGVENFPHEEPRTQNHRDYFDYHGVSLRQTRKPRKSQG